MKKSELIKEINNVSIKDLPVCIVSGYSEEIEVNEISRPNTANDFSSIDVREGHYVNENGLEVWGEYIAIT